MLEYYFGQVVGFLLIALVLYLLAKYVLKKAGQKRESKDLRLSFEVLAETDRAVNHNWSDTSELNYWGRKIGFQTLDEGYYLVEVR